MTLWYVTIPVLLVLAGIPLWVALALFVVAPRLGDLSQQWNDDVRMVALMTPDSAILDPVHNAVVTSYSNLNTVLSSTFSTGGGVV